MISTLALTVCAGLFFCLPARAEKPLFDQEPYDRITLDRNNENKVLKVQPLDLPGRQVPEKPPLGDRLQVRLVDEPDTLYDVQWRMIEKVELFEQMVLGKATELVAAEKLDEAYDYFQFLEKNYPQLPGLAKAMEDYLIEEFRTAYYTESDYARALAMLRELYRRNPRRENLDKALGLPTDKLVAQYRAGKDYRAARKLLSNLAAWFPEHPIVAQHEGQLKQEAEALLAEARKAEQAGDFRQAGQTNRRALQIWPRLPAAGELARTLHEKYPRVVVGVSVPAVDPQPGRLSGWAARRSGRLIYRTLTELAVAGSEGGSYPCPVGQVTVDELEGRLALQIRPDVRWSAGNATLTGYDVSRRLLAMATPGDAAYRIDWAELLAGVEAGGVYRVDVKLHRPHVRPDALLQTTLVPYTTPAAAERPPLPNGPYVVDESTRTDEMVSYLSNPQYFAAGARQPREIVERHFPEGVQAIRALRRGEIQVLDRVNPWGRDVVSGDPNLIVDSYRLPLVHCLIPNMRKPLTARRTFRRALVYGIHRRAILDHLVAGAELPGCQVVSGPFPAGRSLDDPISYAYDDRIEPRTYDPRLAVALATVSLRSLAEAKESQGKTLTEMPRLVLAHPGGEIARVACLSIRQQLELIGVPLELRQFEGPAPQQIPADVDLLYAELAIWEPVVDARRLLGEDGMAGGCSSYMGLALRQLERAPDWKRVGMRLHDIHRIAHDDVAVVPLWQLTDYFAYHKSVLGIGTRPISLYQNIEQWQPAFYQPAEQ